MFEDIVIIGSWNGFVIIMIVISIDFNMIVIDEEKEAISFFPELTWES